MAIFYSGNTILNGLPVPVGSVITAKDPDDVVCGEFVVGVTNPKLGEGKYGYMPVYGDELIPIMPEDEGARSGDVIRFFIDDIPAVVTNGVEPIWQKRSILQIDLAATEVVGDANANGVVSITDAVAILKHVVGIAEIPQPLWNIADVTDNGAITALDAANILQFLVGLITEFTRKTPQAAEVSSNAKISRSTLILPHITAKPGEQIVVPIRIDSANGILAGEITLAYDTSILRLLDISMPIAISQSRLFYKTSSDGVKIAFANTESTNESKPIINLVFAVSPNVSACSVTPIVPEIVQFDEVFQVHLNNGILEILPAKTELLQNYANPFNPETWIPYRLAEPAEVTIKIHNPLGHPVRAFDLGYQAAGSYVDESKAVYWNGKNDSGESVSSGIYFYTMRAGNFVATRKMVIKK